MTIAFAVLLASFPPCEPLKPIPCCWYDSQSRWGMLLLRLVEDHPDGPIYKTASPDECRAVPNS